MSPRRYAPALERIQKRSTYEDRGYGSLCCIYTGGKDQRGYGHISVNGRNQSVHRVTYESIKGPIPEGLELDHLCRQRACCNPTHLEPVTRGENTRRGVYLRPLRLTCPKGHLYTRENLYLRPGSGKRVCRTCWLASANQAAKRRRALALVQGDSD